MNILPQGPAGIGEILGQALSDVAGQFAQHKSTVKALKGLGFSDTQARAYSHLGPQAQQQALHAKHQQEAQEREASMTQQLLNRGAGGVQPAMNASAQGQPQSAPYQGIPKPQLPHEQQQAAIQQATSIAQNPNFRKLNEQQQQAQALQQQQLAKGTAAPQGGPLTGEQQAILQAQAQEAQKEPTPKERLEDVMARRRALVSAPISPTQKKEVHKILQDEEDNIREEIKETRENQDKIDKETAESYQKIKDKYKAAKESTNRINRILELQRAGNLPPKYLVEIEHGLDGAPFGIGKLWSALIRSTYHPDAEELDKLSKDYLKGAKAFFGSRMTEQEAFAILQTVPSLMQTPVGRQRVARNMRIMDDIAKLEYQTARQVIAENGGRRPRDFEEQIEDRTKAQVDELYEKFRTGWYPEEFKTPGTPRQVKPVSRKKEYLIKGIRL